MKKFIIISSLLFVSTSVLMAADIDPMGNKMIEYVAKSPFGKIIGGRLAILDKLKNNNLKEAREIYQYLENNTDKTIYAPFYKQEVFQICILTENYSVLNDTVSLEGIINIDKDWRENGINLPPSDGLYQESKKMLEERKTGLIENGRKALNEEEADFLEILITEILSKNVNEDQDRINKQAEAFLDKYPDSRFRIFINNYIRVVYKIKDKGFGFSFGMGKLVLAGNLKNYFSNDKVLEIALDIYNQRMLYDIEATVGIANETKESFTHRNEIWDKGTSTVLSTIGLQTGYKMDINKKMEFYPLLGLTYYSFYPGQNEVDNNHDHNDIYSWAITYGFAWDIKLGNKSEKSQYYWNEQGKSSRLRVKFIVANPRFSDQIKGNIYRVSLIYNFSFWQIERDM